jgi:diadenosine tetraphosphate (Ap4A) HIT family hydrolase
MDSHPNIGSCLLCDEMTSQRSLSCRLSLYGSDSEKILVQSEHFALIPDISPLLAGHSLLMTRVHISSFSELPPSWMKEFAAVRLKAISHVARTVESPFLFEHGSAGAVVRSGVCIQHAHIHLIPSRAPVRDWMEELGEVEEIRCAFQQLPSFVRMPDYLCYEDQDGHGYLLQSFDIPIPCQFIRRQLARYSSLPSWNWKEVFSRDPQAVSEGGIW